MSTLGRQGDMDELLIHVATIEDFPVVSGILGEAAQWLEQKGMPLWREGEMDAGRMMSEIEAGLFYLAEVDKEPAGTVRFQLEDAEIWPDVPAGEAAYIHRLAVRRRFAGGRVSGALIRWAVERTRSLGLRYLRLDCNVARPRLRSLYEGFGFRHHSNRRVGPYHDARFEYEV